jgi:hypothetical protein
VQAGERGEREVAFYAAIEQHRQAPGTAAAAADGGAGDRPSQSTAANSTDDARQAAATMQQLAEWVPRSCEWRAAVRSSLYDRSQQHTTRMHTFTVAAGN